MELEIVVPESYVVDTPILTVRTVQDFKERDLVIVKADGEVVMPHDLTLEEAKSSIELILKSVMLVRVVPRFPILTEPATEGRTYSEEEWRAIGGPAFGVGSDGRPDEEA
jgi:hypothetical protein